MDCPSEAPDFLELWPPIPAVARAGGEGAPAIVLISSDSLEIFVPFHVLGLFPCLYIIRVPLIGMNFIARLDQVCLVIR